MLNFRKHLALLIAIASIFSGLLSPVLGLNFAAGTAGGGAGDTGGDDTGGDDTGGDDTGGDDTGGDDTGGDDTGGDGTGSELQPDPDPCLEDPNAEGCEDPCIEDPTLEGCEDPCIQDPTLEGCEPTDDCDPSYPDICVPSPPPTRNCNDISDRNFKVVGSDPHGFDGDNDGIGCESSGGNNGSGAGSSGGSGNSDGSSTSTSECQGQADCFRGTVTEIVDGDTIDINNVRIRLALTNTPARGENGYSEAIDFVESVCSVGTRALVDEDDRQKKGSFSRLIGLVYCGDSGINNKESLNELLLESGHAVIDQDFCATSEVSSASWAQRYGC
jgi:hypothetical protein